MGDRLGTPGVVGFWLLLKNLHKIEYLPSALLIPVTLIVMCIFVNTHHIASETGEEEEEDRMFSQN